MGFAVSYVLDRELVQLNAYRLLCLFYANKEIARLTDPTDEYPDPAKLLELKYFPSEMAHLLLTIAISVRTLDDQARLINSSSKEKLDYIAARDVVNKRYSCIMFEEMTLREACNKIIHASVVEPHSKDGVEMHLYDEYMWEGWQESHQDSDEPREEPKALGWTHLSGHVRLGGKQNGKQWWHLLDVPVFVEAVQQLLSGEAI